MKKIMIMLLAVITITCAWALTGGSGQGYDPTNPPDPSAAYRLTVGASPSRLGDGVSPSGASMRRYGEQIYLSARTRVGYDFRCWMEGEEVVSTDRDFQYEMPDRNVTLIAWYDRNTHYDPENPGDPFFDGYTHRVNVYCTPSAGGSVSNSNFLLKEGEETTLYAYPGGNYKFSCWKADGKIISVSPELPVKMGTENLSYTAQFVYSPANPGDPGTNNWTPALGELVIDDFRPGDLWGTISRLVGDDTSAVSRVTVIGRIDDYDLSAMRNLPAVTEVDFSRAYGASRVPDWTFQGCEALTRVLLPASITSIDYYAFNGCVNLSELTCYASMPPSVGYEAFGGVPETMVVKVYSNSLDLYQQAETWRDYKIMTLDEETTALNVTLPADAADGRYTNASLQLNNLATGQSVRLVVTPTRNRYIFGNLIPGMKYTLFALAPGGQVIGEYADFEIPEEGLDYQFDKLAQLLTVTLDLKGSDGKELTDMAQINWFDDRHAFIGSGASLPGQVAGYRVSYEIIPSREMNLAYLPPAPGEWTVKADANAIGVTAKAIESVEIRGHVYDTADDSHVGGAYVILTQSVNGETDSRTVTADAEGFFSVMAADMPGRLTAGSPEHIEGFVDFASPAGLAKGAAIGVKPIYGADIAYTVSSAPNVAPGEEHVYEPYGNPSSISFDIYDLTAGHGIDNYRLRDGRIRLLDGVADNAELSVVAIPRDPGYNSHKVAVTLDRQSGRADFRLLRDGDLRVSCADGGAENPVALLYGPDGQLMKRADLTPGGETTFLSLPEGRYTVVAMMNSSLYSGAGSLAELAASRLTAGTDYLQIPANVTDGYLSAVEFPAVPAFDESVFYYTGPSTMVGLNRSSVTVGQTVTVRSSVDFLPEYAGRIEKVNMIFTLPEGVDMVENSLLVPGGGSNFTTLSDGRISVDLPVEDASPRFCIIPRKSGDWRIGGSVEFELDGEKIVQPIGSQLLSASDFTLSAPDYTYLPRVTVRGFATPLSEVRVYDNDVPVGRARSLTNGEWRLSFDLYNPGDGGEHRIYADITTADGVKYVTSVARTIYDPAWAQLTGVQMIYGGSTVLFDQVEATTEPASYTYWPGTDMFTFKAIFRDGAAASVSSLDFLIILSDGSVKRMDSKYLESQDAWVCAVGFDDTGRLPVNVRVLYSTDEAVAASTLEAPAGAALRCPDAVPVIDPSGYVYEAVASNRLEGVQATIFYKEWAEDMYGDVYENVIRWDAEAYAQRNPLFTDADGMYRWDVPSGEWQVRFEKEGYEPASTEWLPVPPPQLDVNMGLVQLSAPAVEEVKAYEQAVEVSFSKYMQPASLNSQTVVVTVDGTPVEGTLSMLGEETAPDVSVYARGVRFDAAEPFASENVTVMIGTSACSYAGVRMEADYTQEFDVEPEITGITAPESVEAYIGDDLLLPVAIMPGEAAAGKRIVVTLSSPLATVEGESVADAEGNAELHLIGELPGETRVQISVEGSQAAPAVTRLMLSVKPEVCVAPVSSVADGKMITDKDPIELSTATADAQIIYTLDGSDPAVSETAMVYTEPIFIEADTQIRAIVRKEGALDSEEASFSYRINIETGVGTVVADYEGFTLLDDGSILISGDCVVTVYDPEGVVLAGPVRVRAGGELALPGHGIRIVRIGDAPGVKIRL